MRTGEEKWSGKFRMETLEDQVCFLNLATSLSWPEAALIQVLPASYSGLKRQVVKMSGLLAPVLVFCLLLSFTKQLKGAQWPGSYISKDVSDAAVQRQGGGVHKNLVGRTARQWVSSSSVPQPSGPLSSNPFLESSNTGALSTSFLISSCSTIRLLPEIKKENREILVLFSSLLPMLGPVSLLHVWNRQCSQLRWASWRPLTRPQCFLECFCFWFLCTCLQLSFF